MKVIHKKYQKPVMDVAVFDSKTEEIMLVSGNYSRLNVSVNSRDGGVINKLNH